MRIVKFIWWMISFPYKVLWFFYCLLYPQRPKNRQTEGPQVAQERFLAKTGLMVWLKQKNA